MEKKALNVQKLKQTLLIKNQQREAVSDEFVKEHMSIVESVASSLISSAKVPPGIDFGDLTNWGVEGLIKAKKNYKESKGAVFKTYAFYRIKGEMLDKIRSEWHYRNSGNYDKHRKKLRERIVEYATEQLESSLEGATGSVDNVVKELIEGAGVVYMVSMDTVEVISEQKGTKNPEIEHIDENDSVLWEEINKLEGYEWRIVDMFYVQGLKQVEISEKLNFSKSKVCRIHMQVLQKLKNRLKKRYYGE